MNSLSNINTASFRFGISVPLYLEYQYRIEKLFVEQISTISEKGEISILKALAFYAFVKEIKHG